MKANVLIALLTILVLSIGCYETKYTLGDPSTAKVDRALVGDYEQTEEVATIRIGAGGDQSNVATTEPSKDKVRLSVRNLDDKRYFAEWTEIPTAGVADKSPLRMTAFTIKVKGVTFVHLQELTDDGQIPEKHLIMRIALSADQKTLTLRNMSEEFFKTQTIDSNESLRKLIEAHVNDEGMYDKETVTMNRLPK